MSTTEATELLKLFEETKQRFGFDSPELVEPLEKLSYAFHTAGSYEQAESCYRKILSLREQFMREDKARIIFVLHCLAILMRIQNRFSEAEPYYLRAIQITSEEHGDCHPETATRKNYLAGLYFAWGKFDLARALVEQSRAVYSQVFGEQHELVGVAAMGLALIAHRQGRSYEANEFFKQADKLLPAGPLAAIMLDFKDLAASLFFLSKEKFKQGKIDEAETLFRYSLLIETDRLWPGHRIVGDNVQLLGDLYRSQYMVVEAEFLYRKALEIRRSVMGDDHLDVAVSANSLGTLLHDNRRYEEAATFLMQACDIRAIAGFPPLLANSLRAYAACLRQLHRVSEAEECERKARNIFERYNPS